MRDGPWKLIHVQDYGDALYNLAEDQGESRNLAAVHPTRLNEMRQRLDQWKDEMEEPRWGEEEQWFRIHSKNHIRIIEGR
jgi:arylsulfatase A-like enzyme